jgi:hypothetical protein
MDTRLAAVSAARAAGVELVAAFDRFCFDPIDLRLIGAMRVLYAALLLVNVAAWGPDLLLWFGESGVMPYAYGRDLGDSDTLTLLALLPKTDLAVQIAYAILIVHIVLLGVGLWSRLQAVGTFVWLVSFYHRHAMLFDGEDSVFRLLGAALIFLPLANCYSLDAWFARRRGEPYPQQGSAWALRLVQLEISLIYLSTAWEKLRGSDWLDGTALYYVSRLDDLFGHFWIPDAVLGSLTALRLMTWSVLAIEVSLPFLLWIPRTRRLGILLAVALHLGIEYSMSLFLFEWIMLLGVLAFVRPEDLSALRDLLARLRGRLPL